MRRIGVVTGSRADYGHLLPVLRLIRADASLDLRLLVTGMHLSREFGRTADRIREDGFTPAAVIGSGGSGDTPETAARIVGKIEQRLVSPLRIQGIELLLVLGDRGEMLAAAVAATYLRIPIAHLHGGELTGHVDEPVRHAITRLAHLHLPATENSAERLRRTGEEPWRIHTVGAPRLDAILARARPLREEVLRAHGLDPTKPLLLVIQHPTAKDRARAGRLLRRTLSAVTEFDANIVALYPNGDPGSLEMIRVLRESSKRHGLVVYKSLKEDAFLDLLSSTSVLVGNSSSGIIEAPSLKVPAVNIGDRQEGRERARNVIDVPYDAVRIRKAVERALSDPRFRRQVAQAKSPWGDGHAARRIVAILKSVRLDARLLDKRLTF